MPDDERKSGSKKPVAIANPTAVRNEIEYEIESAEEQD